MWYFIRSVIHHFVNLRISLLFIVFLSVYICLFIVLSVNISLLFSLIFHSFLITLPPLPFPCMCMCLQTLIGLAVIWAICRRGRCKGILYHTILFYTILYSITLYYYFLSLLDQIIKRMTHWIIQYFDQKTRSERFELKW